MNYNPLIDACWSSIQVRTAAMPPLIAAFKDWQEWDQSHVKWAVEQIAIQTVKRIIAEMDCLPEKTRNQCRNVNNTTTALEAAQAAKDFAGMKLSDPLANREAKWAAYEATDKASWAAADAGWGAKRVGASTPRGAGLIMEETFLGRAVGDTLLAVISASYGRFDNGAIMPV